jgi:CheY-like chemotaxis protein
MTISELGRPPNILLIDDNRGDAKLMEIAFARTEPPTRMTVAPTAEQGLEMLQGRGDMAPEARPDIVFLDLNLPSMHGLTFLELVKTDPDLSCIPVLVISSSKARKDIADCYRRHANGFVTKPFNLDGYEIFAGSVCAYWFKLVQMPLARA